MPATADSQVVVSPGSPNAVSVQVGAGGRDYQMMVELAHLHFGPLIANGGGGGGGHSSSTDRGWILWWIWRWIWTRTRTSSARLLQIQTQILRDREILVVAAGSHPSSGWSGAGGGGGAGGAGSDGDNGTGSQIQQLPVVVVESVFNYHQLSKIQDLHQHQMVVV